MHHGTEVFAGHYTSLVRCADSTWFTSMMIKRMGWMRMKWTSSWNVTEKNFPQSMIVRSSAWRQLLLHHPLNPFPLIPFLSASSWRRCLRTNRIAQAAWQDFAAASMVIWNVLLWAVYGLRLDDDQDFVVALNRTATASIPRSQGCLALTLLTFSLICLYIIFAASSSTLCAITISRQSCLLMAPLVNRCSIHPLLSVVFVVKFQPMVL